MSNTPIRSVNEIFEEHFGSNQELDYLPCNKEQIIKAMEASRSQFSNLDMEVYVPVDEKDVPDHFEKGLYDYNLQHDGWTKKTTLRDLLNDKNVKRSRNKRLY